MNIGEADTTGAKYGQEIRLFKNVCLVYPEKSMVEKHTCIPVFIAAPFTVARTGNKPRCPSTSEQIKKLRSMHTMECYSAIKRNTFESVLMR